MNDKYYARHEEAYRRFKDRRKHGWHSAEEQESGFQVLEGLRRMGVFPRTGRLLELGCGDGEKSLWFSARGYAVTGVDISPTAVEWAQEKARDRGMSAEFLVDDVVGLKTQGDASVDVALDAECLHCLVGEDRKAYLASAFRVVRPGGLFVVFGTMCQPIRKPEELIKPPVRFDPEARIMYDGDTPFRHLGLPEEIVGEVRAAGFAVHEYRVEAGNAEGRDEPYDRLRVVARKGA